LRFSVNKGKSLLAMRTDFSNN